MTEQYNSPGNGELLHPKSVKLQTVFVTVLFACNCILGKYTYT